MGNVLFHNDPTVDWECEWEWGPVVEESSTTVEDIRQSLSKYELHNFVYGEELSLGRWVSKKWNTIDSRKCLSWVLKCEISDWANVDCCEAVEKLYPDVFMRAHQGYQDKYFIRKKYNWEIY